MIIGETNKSYGDEYWWCFVVVY